MLCTKVTNSNFSQQVKEECDNEIDAVYHRLASKFLSILRVQNSGPVKHVYACGNIEKDRNSIYKNGYITIVVFPKFLSSQICASAKDKTYRSREMTFENSL